VNAPAPESADAVRRGRAKLALLGLFFLVPFAASTLIWWLDLVPGSASNYGTLLQPRPVALPPNGELKGKWILVQFDSGACGPDCERKLYFMRQVRRAQGREMPRVARLWMVTDSVVPASALLEAIQGTVVAPRVTSGDGTWPAERSEVDHIYLVDPLGNLMMRFPRDPDPARVIKDQNRLLKASSFG